MTRPPVSSPQPRLSASGGSTRSEASPPARGETSKPLVYIAAPYTHPDPVWNTHEAARVWSDLWLSGEVTPLCPHVSLLLHLVCPLPVEDWYAFDIELLLRCDAVLRLPGDSTGADREVAVAESRGIPVFHNRGELFAWAKLRRSAPITGGAS